MGRSDWTIDGQRYPDAEPLEVSEGEWVSVTLRNRSMVAHPMHVGPTLRKNSGSTGYARSPLLLVRASTFAVSRTGPGIEGESFRGNPGLMRWSRLENLQPGGYLPEGVLG